MSNPFHNGHQSIRNGNTEDRPEFDFLIEFMHYCATYAYGILLLLLGISHVLFGRA